jgi:hypothetical protein
MYTLDLVGVQEVRSGKGGTVRTGIYYEQIEVRECLLSFSAECFVFQLTVQKYKDEDIRNCNFACCFLWA